MVELPDPTTKTTAEIVEIANDSYQRVIAALQLLHLMGAISAIHFEGLAQHVSVMNGALNIVSSRAATPEDITG